MQILPEATNAWAYHCGDGLYALWGVKAQRLFYSRRIAVLTTLPPSSRLKKTVLGLHHRRHTD